MTLVLCLFVWAGLGGCQSVPESLAIAPAFESGSAGLDRDPPRGRSEDPGVLVTAAPLLEVLLCADVGLPMTLVQFPGEPGLLGLGGDGQTTLALGGLAEEPPAAGAAALVEQLAFEATRRRDTTPPHEIDTLFLGRVIGHGHSLYADLLGSPQVNVDRIAFSGLAPELQGGREHFGDPVLVQQPDGSVTRVVAGAHVMESGTWNARSYTRSPRRAPALASILEAGLQRSPGIAFERVYAGRPNLENIVPSFGVGGLHAELVHPTRHLTHQEDPAQTDRSASIVLELSYGSFRMLLAPDLDHVGQAALAGRRLGSTGWDCTVLLVPTMPDATAASQLARSLDAQAAVGFGGGGSARYPASLLASRLRPGTLHLTRERPRPRNLRVRTDGRIFTVLAEPVGGGRAETLVPWSRCLSPVELDGLCDAR